tara:strand:+ start:525 stop:662 length:138 start_codon:yes stop_codon:yes gene_type:complete
MKSDKLVTLKYIAQLKAVPRRIGHGRCLGSLFCEFAGDKEIGFID